LIIPLLGSFAALLRFSAASHSVALLGELDQERQRLAFLFIVPAYAQVGWPLPEADLAAAIRKSPSNQFITYSL
jgi:hypothetical protein